MPSQTYSMHEYIQRVGLGSGPGSTGGISCQAEHLSTLRELPQDASRIIVIYSRPTKTSNNAAGTHRNSRCTERGRIEKGENGRERSLHSL